MAKVSIFDVGKKRVNFSGPSWEGGTIIGKVSFGIKLKLAFSKCECGTKRFSEILFVIYKA